ncbi:MAG: hypothetical protein GY828_02335, partial [Candidatus Gracilibacteria bacterium]|nr:hypothetical protein [Candidatus Gracilibacteria bacterium]
MNCLKKEEITTAELMSAFVTVQKRISSGACNETCTIVRRNKRYNLQNICTTDQQFIVETLIQHHNIYKNKLMNNSIIPIKLPLGWKYVNNSHNSESVAKMIYLYCKLINDQSFRKKVGEQLDYKLILRMNILAEPHNDCRIMLTEKIFEYDSSNCSDCNGKLTYSMRMGAKGYKKYCGTKAIVFCDMYPPQLAVSYSKKCTKCKITFTFGEKQTSQGIKRNMLAGKKYYEVSRSTYISIKLMETIEYYVLGAGLSIKSFIDAYNKRWRGYNDLINQQIKSFGQRKITTERMSELNYNRVRHTWHLYCLQKIIEEELELPFEIKTNDLEQMMTNEEMKVRNVPLKNKISKGSIYDSIIFKYMWTKYGSKIEALPSKELNYVPVKHDEVKDTFIYPGHFVVYGDGCQKIRVLQCAYPIILKRNDWIDEQKENGNNSTEQYNFNLNHKMFFQCAGSPQRSNIKENRFDVCQHHCSVLSTKYNISTNNINTFVRWFRMRDKIQSLNEKQNKKKTNKENNLKRINHFEKLLSKLPQSEVEQCEKIRNKLLLPKHSEDSYDFDCIHAEDDDCIHAEDDDCIDTAINDDNNVKIYNINDERDLLHSEITDYKVMRKTKGCRKPENLDTAAPCQTCGVNAWFTCSGFCINLREESYRETSTLVIFETADMFMKNSTNRNIAERIEAIGYDMMCRIFGRLYTLAKTKRLSDIRYCFWMNLINRAFVDGFHIATHKTDMCENKDGRGAFHPKLSKFKKKKNKKIKVAMNKKV